MYMKRDKSIQVETTFRKYTLGAILGEGGKGRTHKATDTSGGEHGKA